MRKDGAKAVTYVVIVQSGGTDRGAIRSVWSWQNTLHAGIWNSELVVRAFLRIGNWIACQLKAARSHSVNCRSGLNSDK